jgi:hypothetical protein
MGIKGRGAKVEGVYLTTVVVTMVVLTTGVVVVVVGATVLVVVTIRVVVAARVVVTMVSAGESSTQLVRTRASRNASAVAFRYLRSIAPF